MMNDMNYTAILHSLAEEAIKGTNDRYMRELCSEVADDFGKSFDEVYKSVERIYRNLYNRS